MNNKHKKTLEQIFTNPVQSNILWNEIEQMLIAMGAEVSEGNGSRVRISFNERKAIFHRPHPAKETNKGALISMRRFLKSAGVDHVKI